MKAKEVMLRTNQTKEMVQHWTGHTKPLTTEPPHAKIGYTDKTSIEVKGKM